MGSAKRGYAARYCGSRGARASRQRHGRPSRSVCCWRSRGDCNQPRRDFNRPKTLNQEVTAHADVRNFLVMAAIEISLLIDKPNARYFAVTILAVGLILRGLVQERRMEKEGAPQLASERLPIQLSRPPGEAKVNSLGDESILCAIRSAGRTLDFALREAHNAGARLCLLFVREQPFMTEQDAKRKWQEDAEASAIFAEAKQKAGDHQPLFAYAVSPSAAETIVDVAATLGAPRVILGAPQRSDLVN